MDPGSLHLALIASVLEAGTIEEVFTRVERAARTIGFERVRIAAEFHQALRHPRVCKSGGCLEPCQVRRATEDFVTIRSGVDISRLGIAPIAMSSKGCTDQACDRALAKPREYCPGSPQRIAIDQGSRVSSTICFSRAKLAHDDAQYVRDLMMAGKVLASCAHTATSKLLHPSPNADAAPHLTNRELEILKYVSLGKSSGVIATILAISVPTVQFHVQNTLKKLGVSTRLQAVTKAMQQGLLV